MFSPLRNRFGIPGAISVIALVFAMFGGAYAASNDNGGSGKATASAKKGPPGPRGKQGKPGKPGAAGPAGPQGPAGANGKDGSNGANGKDGESVKLSAAASCLEGGTKLTVGAQSSEVCNGDEGEPGVPGEPGENGEPWTAGGTLPEGATETGAWSGKGSAAGQQLLIPISIPIPLADAPEPVLVPEGAGSAPGCSGVEADGTPKADEGKLCVYVMGAFQGAVFSLLKPTLNLTTMPEEEQPGATTTGTLVLGGCTGTICTVNGVWAATGE
jgi:hypothetical protein